MKGIIYDNHEDALGLSKILWQTIEPIKKGDTTTYCEVVKHPSKQLCMCQIVESGYYWELVENKLTELNLIDRIEYISEDWRN